MASATCRCGTPLPPPKDRGRARKWCSETCRVRHYHLDRRAPRSCAECGVTIPVAAHGGLRFCSVPCRTESHNRRIRMDQDFECQDCGAGFSRPPRRGQRPKWCDVCRSRRRQINVPQRIRRAVFERDGWICQLCFEPVDRSAPSRSDWAPSIDHIIPRSVMVDDRPENLRLAHHWCNSVRADDRTYTAADLAAA